MEWIELGKICDIKAGQGAPQNKEDYSNDGIPFIRAGNLEALSNGASLEICDKIKNEIAIERKMKLQPAGTVVFAKSGMSCLKSYIYRLNDESYVVNHLACLFVKNNELYSKYLEYVLMYIKPARLINDISYPSIRLSDISKFKIPLPPLEVQKRIVEVLDQSQSLIDNRKAQLKYLDNLIEATFYDMFGDPVRNEKGWEIERLGNLSFLITKGSSPTWQGIEYVDDENQVMFITSENVREGYLDLTKRKFLERKFNEIQNRSILKRGDFLINIVGASIGRACEFNLDVTANINQAVSLVRIDHKKVKSKFLLVFLNSKGASLQYNLMKVSVAQANLSLQNIGDLQIPIPPIHLQNEFAHKVEEIELYKARLNQSLSLLEDNYHSLMQRAFKGELFT